MKIIAINDIQHPDYPLIQTLYLQSFPPEERRLVDDFQNLITNNTKFILYHISENNVFVGFLTLWQFSSFNYIEHFAIVPQQRCKGFGSLVLKELETFFNCPLVLEIEIPTTQVSINRSLFYKRNGFQLWTEPQYMQPPYQKNLPTVPLALMSKGNLNIQTQFKTIVSEIYHHVYHTDYDSYYTDMLPLKNF